MWNGHALGKNALEPNVLILVFASLLMGATLGIFGAGGSILTVPLLVYVAGFSAKDATHASLGVVSIVAALGFYLQKNAIDKKAAWKFALPAVLGVLTARKILLPSLPVTFSLGSLSLSLDALLLVLFGLLMIAASLSMLFLQPKDSSHATERHKASFVYPVFAFTVGLVTGFLGAGGGFLIVPALVFFAPLRLKEAMSTSLLVIAVNAGAGFLGGITNTAALAWDKILWVLAAALLGMVLGLKVQKKLPAEKLKPLFGVFILFLGAWLIYKQLA